MDVEDSVQRRLVEFGFTLRLTVPVKPLSGETVIVDVPVVPVATLTLAGLAAIVKSSTW
jgi:hypothetical protein